MQQGLQKENKAIFEFDLEKEIRADLAKGRTLLATVERDIQKLKEVMRKGTPSEEFEEFGVLLHGFTAAQRVLTRIINKK
jgi:hypothetical protein